MQNKGLLQAVLSPDLQWKVGNTGPASVFLTRQYNPSEESYGEEVCYLFVKKKNLNIFLLEHL